MNWINANHPEWFRDHASEYGAQWVEPKDYPKDMEPVSREAGALIKPNGEVLHRIKNP